jgi:cytochrome P450
VSARAYPPGPSSLIPLLATFAVRRDPLSFLVHAARTYGDIVHLALGSRHDYLVNRPDLIREVLLAPEEQLLRSFPRTMKRVLGDGLLSSQGAYHRAQRRMIQPFFHQNRVAGFAREIVARTQRTCGTWRHGERLDIAEAMLALTLEVVVKVVFDRELDRGATDLLELLAPLVDTTRKRRWGLLERALGGLPFGPAHTQELAVQRLDSFIEGAIAERRDSPEGHPDLLSMLLEAGAADRVIRDETLTMLAAGHETIGNCLAWTFHLLATHPEAERRLQAEVDGLDAPLGAESVDRLPFTGRVLLESMRLYPPVWLMVRRPVQDFRLGEYVVPAGGYIHLSQYLTHRDARWFPDPGRFDPDRWLPEAEGARPKICYFPFGGGGRKCIGEGFAFVEGVLVLATVARQFRLRSVPGHPVEPEPYVTLRPRYGLPMQLERRASA